MTSKIIQSIDESIQTKKNLLSDEITLSLIEDAITLLVTAFRQDKKVLFCGNGGSLQKYFGLLSRLKKKDLLCTLKPYMSILPM